MGRVLGQKTRDVYLRGQKQLVPSHACPHQCNYEDDGDEAGEWGCLREVWGLRGWEWLTGENDCPLAQGYGALSWTPLLGNKDKLSKELLTEAVPASSPALCLRVYWCSPYAFTPKLCGQVTGNLHVALSNGLLGLYVILSDTLDHLFLPEARFPRHRGHPTVLVLLLLHWPICHSLLLASLLLLFPRCSVKAWSGPSSSPWAFSLSSFIYQHVHLDSSLASQTSQIKQAYGTLDAPPSVHIWLSPTSQYEALAIIHLIPNAPRVTGEHSWPLAFLFFSIQPNSESWWLSFKQIGYEPVSLWSPPQPSRSKLLSCLLWLIKWPPNWSQYFLSCLFQPVFHRVLFERHIMLLCYLKSFSDGPLPWR